MGKLGAAFDDLGAPGCIFREPCQGLLSVAPGPECQRLLLRSPFDSGEHGGEPDQMIIAALADMERHHPGRWWGLTSNP
jgi:hypothetical protein